MKKYVVGLLILAVSILGYTAAERVIKADKILSNSFGTSGVLEVPTSGTVTIPSGTHELLVNDLSNITSAAEYDFSVDTSVNIRASDGTAAEFRFYDDSDLAYTGFVAPSSLTTNTMFILPDGDGLPGEALTTDGSGNLSWSSASATLPTTTNGDLIVHNGTTNVRLPAGSTNQLLAVGTGSPSLNYVSSLTSIGINADNNSITNIDNNEIKAGAAIDATKIADGSVTSTEFQYIGGLTSDAQTQISARVPNSAYTASGDVLVGTGSGTYSAVGATDQNTNNSIVRRDSGGAAEFTTIKNGLGNIVYDAVSGQIRSISGTLISDHSGTSLTTYWPIAFGNVTNNISGPITTLRTSTAAAGGTSYTLTLPPTNANGALINDGAGNLTWGTAGSGSFNYIENPGWEGNSNDWTASGGTYARTTTTAQIGSGVGAGSWDSNAASQTLTSDAISIFAGAYGQNGVVSCKFKAASGTATHLLQAWDGTNVLASQTITSDTVGYPRTNVNFVFPSSGSIRARIVSVASNEPAIYIDDCYLGLAEGFNVSQVGIATSWQSFTPTGSWVTNTTYTGKWRRVGDTLEVQFEATLSGAPTSASLTVNLPTGLTIDTAKLELAANNFTILGHSSAADNGIANYSGFVVYNNTTSVAAFVHNASATYATGAGVTQALPFTFGSGDTVVGTFSVPIVGWTAETAIAANTSELSWSGTSDLSGTNTSASLADFGSITGSVTQRFASGISCSATSGQVGVDCTLPRAGRYLACFSGFLGINPGPGNAYIAMTDGANNIIVGENLVSYTPANAVLTPVSGCGIFNASSSGTSTFKLRGYRNVAATATGSLRHFSIVNISQGVTAPILVGSVTSNSTGAERVERATINCDATPTITRQSGSWVSGVSQTATGDCTITIASGLFSDTPTCHVSGLWGAGGYGFASIASVSTTSLRWQMRNSAGTLADIDTFIICQGPR